METKVEEQPTFVDTAKLALAVLILLAGLVAYYYFASSAVLLRAFGVIVALAAALGVLYTSFQGQQLWKFIQGSRVELRKVVWPTREETIQTTLVVLIFALIGGVFFWLLDLLLLFVTSRITGQGGL
ncbi:MAG TPA: preprotein translocase subunit SecE [Gammaproteobacteria bacterium]|jgi:preprotein translocase subunit SecE|nr:preprotein translocase subunit SecE [Gammaproteobacteria bacterium]